jgi:pilus assembly protein CpaF
VFVARRGRSELTTTILAPGELADLVERMLRTSGRRIDMSTPFVDATMPDGSRLHVVIPDMIDARCLTSAEELDCRVDLRKCRWSGLVGDELERTSCGLAADWRPSVRPRCSATERARAPRRSGESTRGP